jgi:hypothetical protein
LGSELVEVEKMLRAENDDTPMRSHWIKVRKTDCPPDADSSYRDNLFQELRCFLKNVLWTKETSLRILGHLGKIEFSLRREPPSDDTAPTFCKGIDSDLGGD